MYYNVRCVYIGTVVLIIKMKKLMSRVDYKWSFMRFYLYSDYIYTGSNLSTFITFCNSL